VPACHMPITQPMFPALRLCDSRSLGPRALFVPFLSGPSQGGAPWLILCCWI
ncbi:hypothetical protein GOODEAATRI_011551, partial [Goodea atripinnis]